MTALAENTNPRPFEIEDARAAEHMASESQRKLADELAKAHGAVADAEYTYRTALSNRWKQLKEEGWAATVCGDIARGEESIATLRRERGKRRGELAAIEQECFRAGADRRALDGLVDWSKHRDLRTDAPIPDGFRMDQQTGELRRVA